jgi:murein DD-endopeptidase
MGLRDFARIAVLIALMFAFTGCSIFSPVSMEVIATPYAIPGAAGTTLVYEVYLSDYRTHNLELKKVEVYADDALFRTYLKEDFQPEVPGSPVFLAFPATIAGMDDSTQCKQPVLYFAIPLNTGEKIPTAVSHKLYFKKKVLCCSLPVSAAGGKGTLSTEPLMVLAPPFRGERFANTETMMAWTHHRQGISVFDGKPYISQRFALDWFKLTESGTMCVAPFNVNASHPSYNVELIAVASGKVVRIINGILDNTPPGRAQPVTGENVAGNLVVIKIAENRYAFYGHCIPDSILVKEGDDVVTGQVIARLGNSGNSDAPHLHFQIADGTSLFESQGIPFVLDSFTYTGTYHSWDGSNSLEESALEFTSTPLTPTVHTNEFLENGMVCTF